MKLFHLSNTCRTILVLLLLSAGTLYAQSDRRPSPLAIGFNIGADKITAEKMQYAKSVGIDYIETSLGAFVAKGSSAFNTSDEKIIAAMKEAKKNADDAGITIWSIHMPFSPQIDLSLVDESKRREDVAFHQKALSFVRILEPKVILFHPSYYLGLNEREERIGQFVQSATELNRSVKKIKAITVIENMLGPELLPADGKRERPLLRTVEEAVAIMNRLPADIYSAVDMNHIKHPEKLIDALGERVKSVHIADGNGREENHFFPCSGEGSNDWVAILTSLNKAGYSGPFMFESKYPDLKDLKECYEHMFARFVEQEYP